MEIKSKKTTKVLIADDHAILRQGLKQILSETDDLIVVAEAANGQEVLEIIQKVDLDIVVMDIGMPVKTGWDVLLQLKSEEGRLPILILSVAPEDNYAVSMMKMGAAGYLTKASAPELLVEAIRKVASGEKFISPCLTEKMISDLESNDEQLRHKILSPREFQVMTLIASGKTVSEISRELSVSIPTVSTHRARILEKMKMASNAQLTHYAIKNNIV